MYIYKYVQSYIIFIILQHVLVTPVTIIRVTHNNA